MNVIFLFDFIKKCYGDKETTLVYSHHVSSYRSENMTYFQKLVESQHEIRITDLETKEDIICSYDTIIDYFIFINDKIIIYFK